MFIRCLFLSRLGLAGLHQDGKVGVVFFLFVFAGLCPPFGTSGIEGSHENLWAGAMI